MFKVGMEVSFFLIIWLWFGIVKRPIFYINMPNEVRPPGIIPRDIKMDSTR